MVIIIDYLDLAVLSFCYDMVYIDSVYQLAVLLFEYFYIFKKFDGIDCWLSSMLLVLSSLTS